jgi:hypothetical protein|nr:MAG TPA: hypothetical protein [Caudoviricetes sp.]
MKKIHVIAIPDDKTIYIDSGKDEEIIKKGHILQIVSEGKELFGINGESLGNSINIKEEVEVIEIFEKYSVCKKRKSVKFDFLNFNTDDEYSTLNIDTKDITPLFEDNDIHIKLGDIVLIK